jgi:hypothetical protein
MESYEIVEKIESHDGYDFYRLSHEGAAPSWNIVPAGSAAPTGGYPNRQYIEGIKGVRFHA